MLDFGEVQVLACHHARGFSDIFDHAVREIVRMRIAALAESNKLIADDPGVARSYDDRSVIHGAG